MSYDQVKKETCPECGGDTFHNNFLLRERRHARVFVECATCGVLVARYILHAYVDPGYSFASTMQMMRRTPFQESARAVKDDLTGHQERARTQFEDVKLRIKEASDPTDRRIIEIIHEEGIRTED